MFSVSEEQMDKLNQEVITPASELDERLDWVEPEVKSLYIEDTAATTGHGSDGGLGNHSLS